MDLTLGACRIKIEYVVPGNQGLELHISYPLRDPQLNEGRTYDCIL